MSENERTEHELSLRGLARDTLRLLSFRMPESELLGLGPGHLVFGLSCALLVGAGRYWDNPRANFAQQLGIGSVLYVFVLSGILWIILKLLEPERVSYSRLIRFVALCSPPALLYAIPVERFLARDAAAEVNVWFLGIVASFRVALLFWYLRRALRLAWFEALFAGLLPLSAIVTALTLLNLEHVAFRLMAGLAEHERSANDQAHQVLVTLTFVSVCAFPVLAIGYFIIAHRAGKLRRARARERWLAEQT